MKKKLISVLALVLVLCFVWVAEVDAADYLYLTVSDVELLFASVSSSSNYGNNISVFDVSYNDTLYSYASLWDTGTVRNVTLDNLNVSKTVGDTVSFTFCIIFTDTSSLPLYSNCDLRYYGVSGGYVYRPSDLVIDISSDFVDVISSNITISCPCYIIDVSYTVDRSYTVSFNMNFSSTFRHGIGVLCPYVATGLTNDEKLILQQILLGVDSANQQLDDMQSEQSSYYEEMITPDESNLNAAESMSVALESGKEIVDEYSSLNDSLEKPSVDQLLPDYDRVVDGYVDTSIFDVFSTLYESGYIMFILLITCFFGVMSYALFGKKA